MAMYGILLKSLKSFALQLQEAIIEGFEGDAEELRQFADYINESVGR